MYIDLIFYKFTSNLARQLLIKVISVFGEKRTVYMRRFHTIITKIWICSQCNICFALGANSGIFWNYCISASEFPGQYIFSIFCGVIRWCTTALSTHKLTPVRANVCPSPFIVSNGLENFSAILRALIQGVVGSYLCAINSKPEGRTVFFRRVLFRSLCIGHNSQKSGESERPLSKLIAGKAFARASFRDFRSSGVIAHPPDLHRGLPPKHRLTLLRLSEHWAQFQFHYWQSPERTGVWQLQGLAMMNAIAEGLLLMIWVHLKIYFLSYCLIKVCDVILIIAHGTELLPYLCLKKAGNFLYAHTRMQSDQTFPDNSVPVWVAMWSCPPGHRYRRLHQER